MSVFTNYNLIPRVTIFLSLFFTQAIQSQSFVTWDLKVSLGLANSDYYQTAFLTAPAKLKGNKPDGIILHLHGDQETVKTQFTGSGFNGVLVSLDLGILSGSYERRYFSDGSKFTNLLSLVNRMITDSLKIFSGGDTPVYLTAFSAGYAGVRAILKNHYNKIAGIGLADGLYADFDADSIKNQMTVFFNLAKQSARSEKKFILTHSSLKVKDYMTAAETGDLILKEIHAEREVKGYDDGLGFLETEARKGKFAIKGYKYYTPADHYSHLNNIGRIFRFLKN